MIPTPIIATAGLLSAMFGSVEFRLIVLLIAGAMSLFNWWRQRNQKQEQAPRRPLRPNSGDSGTQPAQFRVPPAPENPGPPESAPATAPAPELSRILRELFELPPAPPAPSPPPLPRVEYRPAVLAAPPRAPVSPPVAAPLSRLDDRVRRNWDQPAEAAIGTADRRETTASELDETATREVEAVVPTPAVLAHGRYLPVRPRQRDLELIAALRNPASVRQFIAASVILGPPKAFDPMQ